MIIVTYFKSCIERQVMQEKFPKGATLMKRLHKRAQLPRYATAGACAFDLWPVLEDEDAPQGLVNVRVLEPGEMIEVRLGWAIMAPKDWCVELHSRSGQGKVRVSLANRTGLIDCDYSGELLALVVNEGPHPYEISEAKAICQGKLAYAPQAEFFEVLVLPTTRRGAGGFGHTDQPHGHTHAPA